MGMIEEKIQQLAREAAAGIGLEVDEVELLGKGRGLKLRIIIDKPGGVSIEDCESMSHEFSALMDVEDPIKGHYTLEVSSPGLDRPLKSPETFRKCMGKLARAVMKDGGIIIGRIMGVDGTAISLETREGNKTVDFSDIAKAKLEVEI